MTRQENFKKGVFSVHPNVVLRTIRGINEHHIGMAELAKNSYGAYLESEAKDEDRIIVFFLRDGNNRKSRETTVACLDFVGMNENAFERWDSKWGDPDAAPTAARFMAGHGTGGKAYFHNMFEGDAYLIGVKNGVKNQRGFRGPSRGQK